MTNPPSFATSSLLVICGGAVGSWLRYMASRITIALIGPIAASNFPYATLSVNVLGSLSMGLLAGWLARHGTGGEHWRLLLAVGVLGGFTTFSSFALEFVLFIERGNLPMAMGYAAISLVAGFGALFAGLYTMRVVG